METYKNKLLIIVFIVMITLFLLFCGGAISVTIADGGMMGTGWTSGISWMWMPALLFLALSFIIGWVVFVKKKVQI
jgi:hypothetical protein